MSLYSDFLAAVEHAATLQRCQRGFTHPPHHTTTGHCPGHISPPILPRDQVALLADTVRQEIHQP